MHSSPPRSENLDLVVSFHSNEIGLLLAQRVQEEDQGSGLLLQAVCHRPERRIRIFRREGTQLYDFNTYINNPNPIDLYGIETEWQTHFWYLPKPFNGLVLNVNYTHIFSKASYPRSIARRPCTMRRAT